MRLTTKRAPVRKALCVCDGGPCHGYALALDAETGCCTAWFELRGATGRYVMGCWEAATC